MSCECYLSLSIFLFLLLLTTFFSTYKARTNTLHTEREISILDINRYGSILLLLL